MKNAGFSYLSSIETLIKFRSVNDNIHLNTFLNRPSLLSEFNIFGLSFQVRTT
eukprot:UN14890